MYLFFQITPMVHFIVILFNDDDDNVIVITLEVIFYTTVAFEIKNMHYQL